MQPRGINYLILMLAVIVWLCIPGIGAAEEGDAGIETIKTARGFDAGEIDYVEAAKRKFSAIGTLDAVYEDRVVVGDANAPLVGAAFDPPLGEPAIDVLDELLRATAGIGASKNRMLEIAA